MLAVPKKLQMKLLRMAPGGSISILVVSFSFVIGLFIVIGKYFVYNDQSYMDGCTTVKSIEFFLRCKSVKKRSYNVQRGDTEYWNLLIVLRTSKRGC